MKRKDFVKKSLYGVGTVFSIPFLSSCNEDEMPNNPNCPTTPTEIKGPFPIKSPADFVRENIIGNRSGVALQINLTIQNTNDNCAPFKDAIVDLWQCDAKGNYSEYDGQQDGDFTNDHFLRGRQVANAKGEVSFISIYPGWYPGRAPHLHLEIKNSSGTSLLATQISFPENISNKVYATDEYNGSFDTSNDDDLSFSDNGNENLPNRIVGNVDDGYLYEKIIKVDG